MAKVTPVPWFAFWFALLGGIMLASCSPDTELRSPRIDDGPPPLALGYDAYLEWNRWPVVRIGQRRVMRSTFDRGGGNHASDASHFLRADEHGYVTLDVAGSGVLSFVRTNHWHGSPWHYVVDGTDAVVSES